MLTNEELGMYLKRLRTNKDITLRTVDELTGINYSRLNLIEKGVRKATPEILKSLADIYDVDVLDLFEKAGYVESVKSENRIPVLGRIPAGIPLEMIEDIIDYEEISNDMLKGGKEYFALKVTGDSMFPEYLDGDVLIVLKIEDCESGQDAIVSVNGFDATFKRDFKSDNGITLQPLNNNYQPQFYSNKDIKNMPIKILGIVKQIRRDK